MPLIEELYTTSLSADVREIDFFEGLSSFISEKADVREDEFGWPYSSEARADLQLIFLKTSRMKEKMKEPDPEDIRGMTIKIRYKKSSP